MSQDTMTLETHTDFEPIDSEEHLSHVQPDEALVAQLRHLHEALQATGGQTARVSAAHAVTWPVLSLQHEGVLAAKETLQDMSAATIAQIHYDGGVTFHCEATSKRCPENLTTEPVALDDLAALTPDQSPISAAGL